MLAFYFLLHFYFFSFTLPVLKTILSCLQHTYKIKLNLEKT